MKAISALEGGLAGALVLTAVHETVRKIDPQAPRMDLLGMSALQKLLRGMGKTPPEERKLFYYTMAGDVLSNSLYYSLAGMGKKKNAVTRGTLLGLMAGLGAVLLPRKIGLNEAHTNRSLETKVLTVMLYTVGGIVASAVAKMFDGKSEEE